MSGGIGVAFAVSSALGPVLGGAIARVDYRWVFLLNVPVCAVLVVVLVVAWREDDGGVEGKKKSWMQIDGLGATLLVAASVLLVFALQEAGAGTYSWDSAVIVGTLVAAGCAWVALGVWIWFLGTRGERVKIQAIIPSTVFQDRILCALLL